MCENVNIVGRRIKSARILKGLSLKDMSSLLSDSITRQAVYRYEKGEVIPSDERLQDIAKVLEQPVSFFHKPYNSNIELGELHFCKIYKD